MIAMTIEATMNTTRMDCIQIQVGDMPSIVATARRGRAHRAMR